MVLNPILEKQCFAFEIVEYLMDYSLNKVDLVGKKKVFSSIGITYLEMLPLYTRNDQYIDGVKIHVQYKDKEHISEFHQFLNHSLT